MLSGFQVNPLLGETALHLRHSNLLTTKPYALSLSSNESEEHVLHDAI
jgi:hypothetical protein